MLLLILQLEVIKRNIKESDSAEAIESLKISQRNIINKVLLLTSSVFFT